MSDEILNKPKFNLNEFFNKNKKSLIVIVITIIFLVIALIITNEYKKQEYTEISEKYNSAKILVENNSISFLSKNPKPANNNINLNSIFKSNISI